MQQQQQLQSRASFRDWFYFLVVGTYLSTIMLYLLATKKLDPGVSFSKLIAGSLRRKAKGTLSEFQQELGFCYLAKITEGPISDADGRSRIKLYENGKLIGTPHCTHQDIRDMGEGRFSHWNNDIYMSTPDNSDPRTNGRVYTFSE